MAETSKPWPAKWILSSTLNERPITPTHHELRKSPKIAIPRREMTVSTAKKLVFLGLTITLLLLCFFTIPSYSDPFCFGRFGCNIEGRRLPYYPSPPIPNKTIRQDDPRAPPLGAAPP
ncbi:hypothetical protein M5K25_024044 [Dendrobium thyrsiflorum]|uniref:Uncharacterized protein n=1 Tax=Dendrobium thyrsiflorum TaxID=117978 RepID=A0ABD0U109_DENTH